MANMKKRKKNFMKIWIKSHARRRTKEKMKNLKRARIIRRRRCRRYR